MLFRSRRPDFAGATATPVDSRSRSPIVRHTGAFVSLLSRAVRSAHLIRLAPPTSPHRPRDQPEESEAAPPASPGAEAGDGWDEATQAIEWRGRPQVSERTRSEGVRGREAGLGIWRHDRSRSVLNRCRVGAGVVVGVWGQCASPLLFPRTSGGRGAEVLSSLCQRCGQRRTSYADVATQRC